MNEMTPREAAIEAGSWAETLDWGRLGRDVAEQLVVAIETAGFTIVPATSPAPEGGDLDVGDGLMASEVAEHLPHNVAVRYWRTVIARALAAPPAEGEATGPGDPS